MMQGRFFFAVVFCTFLTGIMLILLVALIKLNQLHIFQALHQSKKSSTGLEENFDISVPVLRQSTSGKALLCLEIIERRLVDDIWNG